MRASLRKAFLHGGRPDYIQPSHALTVFVPYTLLGGKGRNVLPISEFDARGKKSFFRGNVKKNKGLSFLPKSV